MRKGLALAVRLIAVIAAIYTFYSMRAQLKPPETSTGTAIQVKVVSNPDPQASPLSGIAGWIVAERTTGPGEPAGDLLKQNPSLAEAARTPGVSIPVKSEEEWRRVQQMVVAKKEIAIEGAAFRFNTADSKK